MLYNIKKWWKYSRFRFFLLNTIWNYSFWLNCTTVYNTVSYKKKTSSSNKTSVITKKRFVGYRYKGQLYLKNPGLKIEDRELWQVWRKKGLIK